MRAYVYIMANKRNGTIYVGVTSDLTKRVMEHKDSVVSGFTQKYHCYLLVWYEGHETMMGAITREKQIKEWRRAWKLDLIEKGNYYWRDLSFELV